MAHALPLGVLSRTDAVALLRQRSGVADDGSGDAARVALNLGDLPLALQQAAAVIRQDHLTYGGYLRRFETQWATMLGEGVRSVDYPRSVAMTWSLAFAGLEATAPAAADLLKLAAYLNSDFVPLSLIGQGATEMLPPSLAAVAADPRLWAAATAALVNYSLADVDDGRAAPAGFGLHRLVGMVARDRLSPADRAHWCSVAVRLLADRFRFVSADLTTWPTAGSVLPHVVEAATHADHLRVEPKLTTALLNDAGRYLLKRANFADARAVLDRALSVCDRDVKELDPKRSAIVNNLGRAHDHLGNTAIALQYYGQAITIDTKFYGQTHPHVAEVVNNYAVAMHRTGDRDGARRQFAWAAQIYEHHFGPRHPKLAGMLNNLGHTLTGLGDPAAAAEQLARALDIAEATVGGRHPTTARILFNLAAVHRHAGEATTARDLLARALEIDASALGPDHPDARSDRAALDAVLAQLGEPVA